MWDVLILLFCMPFTIYSFVEEEYMLMSIVSNSSTWTQMLVHNILAKWVHKLIFAKKKVYMLVTTSLPNKDILCLTRTPSLQKRLKTMRKRGRMQKKKVKEAVRYLDGYSKAEQRRNGYTGWWKVESVCSHIFFFINHSGKSLQGASMLLYSPYSPRHHLFFLIGGMAPTADWMNDRR